MRINLIRATALVVALAAPLAVSSAAFAQADNWSWERDSWPLIETRLQMQTAAPQQDAQQLAANPSASISDAEHNLLTGASPSIGDIGRGGFYGPSEDNTSVTYYGSHNPILGRDSEY